MYLSKIERELLIMKLKEIRNSFTIWGKTPVDITKAVATAKIQIIELEELFRKHRNEADMIGYKPPETF